MFTLYKLVVRKLNIALAQLTINNFINELGQPFEISFLIYIELVLFHPMQSVVNE